MKMFENLSQIADEVVAIFGRRYPEFTYGGPFPLFAQEVPVFLFHDNDSKEIESKLIYLKENDYLTITADEYYEWLVHNRKIPDRAVLLTIDDGLANVWQYWFPLLKRYDLKATVFLISGYIRNRSRYLCNLDDLWSGKCTEADIVRRGGGYYNLVYWEEVIEMHRSGHLDFQSHTLFHHRVYRNERLVGFYDPNVHLMFYDWPLPDSYERYVLDGTIEEFAGFPIYQNESIFLSMKRFLDDEELRLGMLKRVSWLGGKEFLLNDKKPNATLNRLFKEISGAKRRGIYRSHEETTREIEENLLRSKEIIESKLDKRVNHLCYPYNFYSPAVMEISKRVGYLSNFIGVHPKKRTNRVGDDPYFTVRLKNDYLETLPGKDRISLRNVLGNKIKRRLAGDKVI